MGQHLVTRLLKGVFHWQPPQPQYTWDVTKVTNYLKSLGDNTHLFAQVLTFIAVMPMVLTSPSRTSYHRPNQPYFGSIVQRALPLCQQSWLSNSDKINLFQNFSSHDFHIMTNYMYVCPVATLLAYKERT